MAKSLASNITTKLAKEYHKVRITSYSEYTKLAEMVKDLMLVRTIYYIIKHCMKVKYSILIVLPFPDFLHSVALFPSFINTSFNNIGISNM